MENSVSELIEPTPRLRFVERNGRMMLQQCMKIIDQSNGKVRFTWRDVPVERGEANES